MKSSPPPSFLFRYWGKADQNSCGEPRWHPLVYHSLDVAACGQVLLNRQPAWLDKLAYLSGIDRETVLHWIVFLLAIHDIGKFGNGFQTLPRNPFKLEPKGTDGVRHDTLGHALATEHMADWLGRVPRNDLELDLLLPWLAAINGHHGEPPRNQNFKALRVRHFPPTVRQDAQAFVEAIQRLLLPYGWPLPEPAPGRAERQQQASWLMAGLAVLADWLGSNTRWFKYHTPDLSLDDYWHQIALPRSEQAVAERGLLAARPTLGAEFAGLFPHIATPTPLQCWADTISIGPGPQLFVLEELTGGGKTEAALTLAARLLAAGRGDGLYFALPTMATADAMFARVKKPSDEGGPVLWERLFSEGTPTLVLAHSAARTAQRLDELQRHSDGGYGTREASASQQAVAWLADSRKKALLADFGVGTIDQALLAVMKLRHQSLRLLGLSTKVLVVDEVHACDCYTGELLARLLHFHAALGGSAILLSATLPLAQRARLLTSFAQGAGFSAHAPIKSDYPLATRLDGSTSEPEEQPIAPRPDASRRVEIDVLNDRKAALRRLRATLERGGCAVWVRNTVADAVEAWREWTEHNPEAAVGTVTLFHARFALADRLNIGKRVLAAFGPESTPETRRGRLVIATQVVEQSLDVDFDDMVTDLAPIDLIIQRAGRLQRHKRNAQGHPAKFDGRGGTRLGVLMPTPIPDAAKGWYKELLPKAATVYGDHGRLWLTAEWLARNGGFDLSKQARDMIEAVYGEEGYARVPEGLKWSSDAKEGACCSERGLARQNLLAFDQGYDATSNQWPDEDAYTEIPTRLGEKTVRLRLARMEDGQLRPWAKTDPAIDWALSELTVAKRLVAQESPRFAPLLQAVRQTMADEGRHCLIVPLEPHSGDEWRGWAADDQGKAVRVIYSNTAGLSIEQGEAIDEFDI